jgi:hypothetical protein
VSTVVLTLVVVGGSIVAAAVIASSGEPKPATEAAEPHRAPSAPKAPRRARRTRRRRYVAPAPVVLTAVGDRVPPRPGFFVRLRALITLAAIVAVIGLSVALLIGAGAAAVSRALESAVQ